MAAARGGHPVSGCLSLDQQKGVCETASGTCPDAALGRLAGAGAGPQLPSAVPSILSNVRPSSLFTSVTPGGAPAVPGSLSTTPALSAHPWASLASAYCSRETLLGRTGGGPSLVSGGAGFIPPGLQTPFHCGKGSQSNGSGQAHAGALGMQQMSHQPHGAVGHLHGRESLPKVVGVRYDKVNKTWRASWYDPQSKRRVERKFSVNKLGFINAYNMATECRKLQEQKLGLRDRTGRKQHQPSKTPSVVARPAGVLGSASLPTCMPQLELQRHQELLAQTSSWAASQSLSSDREKDALQPYLPFDFDRALNAHHLAAGIDAGSFPSPDASALAAFSAATDSFLSSQAALNPLEETQRSPVLPHQHHPLLTAPSYTAKPELHGGPRGISNMPDQQVQGPGLGHPPGGPIPETQSEASEIGICRSSTRSRKRKDAPEEITSPKSCGSAGPEGDRIPSGATDVTQDKAANAVLWTGGGTSRSRDPGRQLSTSPQQGEHEAESRSGNRRHAGGGQGVGQHCTLRISGQGASEIGTDAGKYEGVGQGAKLAGDDSCAPCGGEGQNSREKKEENTAKKPRRQSTNEESNLSKSGSKPRCRADGETTPDDEPADGASWMSKDTDKANVEEPTYRAGHTTSGPNSQRAGGDMSRSGRGDKSHPVIGDRTLSGNGRESKGGRPEGSEDALEVNSSFEKRHGRRGDGRELRDRDERVPFSRMGAECGGRHCGRHSAALQESSCDTSCCSRRWTCTCCGDDCQGFSRPVLRQSRHVKGECAGRESPLASAGYPVTRGRLPKKPDWKPSGESLEASSLSPSSSPHHPPTEEGGDLSGRESAACGHESGQTVAHGRGDRWISSCSLVPDTSSTPTGPLLILHLTKELVLLLLQSVQDALRALGPGCPFAEQFGKLESSADAFVSDRELEHVSRENPWRRDKKRRGDASPLRLEPTAAGEGNKGSERDTGCDISTEDARVCEAAIERHKDIVRMASNVNSLGRYTKIFRICIKTKQVPTQLPHLDLVQLLRQLLSLPRVEEETTRRLLPGSAPGADNAHSSASSTEGSSGYLSPAESWRRLPGTTRSGGGREEKGECDRSGVAPRGGRVSRVTTAETDEGDREEEEGGGSESVLPGPDGDNAREGVKLGGAHPSDGGSRDGERVGAQVHPSSRLSSSRRGCEDHEQEREEGGERGQTKHEHQAQACHSHNTRSKSNLAKGGSGCGGSRAGALHGGPTPCLSTHRHSRAAASRRGAYNTRQLSTEAPECVELNKARDAAAGKEERASGKTERNASSCSPGAANSAADSRGGPQIHRYLPAAAPAAERLSPLTSSQVSPSLPPSPKLPPSICFGDRVPPDSSGHSGDIGSSAPCSSEDGLIEGRDFDMAEGSSRGGEGAVQDSLAQLLL
ncbi:unnamed protein product [Neospora caninum Liverpool]|uniref:Uncharacterized protein n=1 Tax=Neospora caninum (strain Liverpool) TaxID=572307 RepID=F0V9Q2_NEOCL|nr:uncharacterized protein NCLIV_009480 [Neospora caninum Liverpool]CBZ50478.1 unnamed protein product [Neospora caninum Liverpool]|eukprot:XP_003880511.1 uncharacterized protein NCLIV_009480 [Neospora caninum Liverpool]